MTFDNQSKGMHIVVSSIAVVGALSSILAATFQGMYTYEVQKLETQPEQNNWTGKTGYVLSIVTALVVTFVALYVGFDTKNV